MVVRIMLMVPLYAIASLISLFSLEAAFFIDAVRDIYEVRTPRLDRSMSLGLRIRCTECTVKASPLNGSADNSSLPTLCAYVSECSGYYRSLHIEEHLIDSMT